MPLNLFSKSSHHREEPYIRPSLHLIQTDTDSIASDATAPNIPGPGRNLGRLFDALGMRLENVLNRRAGRLNRGPVALAQEIRDLRRYRVAFSLGLIRDGQASPTDEEISQACWYRYECSSKEFDNLPTHEDIGTLKKLCGKLLKYCRSHVLATQLRAFEEVTVLAVEDPYVRGVFADILNVSYLVPKYKERELHQASVKAVISIKDNEVHEFFYHYSRMGFGDREKEQNLNQVRVYLSDPDISFLAARLMRKRFATLEFNAAWKCYIEVATATPPLVECEVLYGLFDDNYIDGWICQNSNRILE